MNTNKEQIKTLEKAKKEIFEVLNNPLSKIAKNKLPFQGKLKNKWIVNVYQAISENLKIQEVIKNGKGFSSLIIALNQAAERGLEVGGEANHAYLIPFKDEVKLIYGYRGMIAYAEKNGVNVTAINTVYENDTIGMININSGTPPEHKLNPKEQKRGEAIGYYCSCLNEKTGIGKTVYMFKDEVKIWRDRFSKNPTGEIWTDHFSSMALKTVIRKCLKHLGFIIKIDDSIEIDNVDENEEMEISSKAEIILDKTLNEIKPELKNKDLAFPE